MLAGLGSKPLIKLPQEKQEDPGILDEITPTYQAAPHSQFFSVEQDNNNPYANNRNNNNSDDEEQSYNNQNSYKFLQIKLV